MRVCVPTLNPLAAKANASWALTVLLPTPPFPLSTSTLCLICAIRSFTKAMAGSSTTALLAPDAHAAWFGHPAQADAFPAVSDDGPTHPSFASSGVLIYSVFKSQALTMVPREGSIARPKTIARCGITYGGINRSIEGNNNDRKCGIGSPFVNIF
jgi:hypothetical protein